jgi:hypothetical protein
MAGTRRRSFDCPFAFPLAQARFLRAFVKRDLS